MARLTWTCVEQLDGELVVRDEDGVRKQVSWVLLQAEVKRGRRVLGLDGNVVSLKQAERQMIGVAGG